YACSSREDFDEAVYACLDMGGRLYEPTSAEALASVASQLPFRSWVGLTDIDTEGTFVFVSTGEEPDFELPFASGEPNNSGNEDCLEVFSSGELNDTSCWDAY